MKTKINIIATLVILISSIGLKAQQDAIVAKKLDDAERHEKREDLKLASELDKNYADMELKKAEAVLDLQKAHAEHKENMITAFDRMTAQIEQDKSKALNAIASQAQARAAPDPEQKIIQQKQMAPQQQQQNF